MANGSSRILTDKVGGLILLGIGAAGIAFLGLRSREPTDVPLPPQPPPDDPNIQTIRVIPVPAEINDGDVVDFQIEVIGGSGALGGDINFGDGQVRSIGPSNFTEGPTGNFNLFISHQYNLMNSQTRDIEILLQLQDAASGIMTTTRGLVRINPAVPVEPDPVAVINNFTQTRDFGESPLNVGFTVDPSDPRSSVEWEFGDGSPKVLDQTILNHLYSGEGIKSGSVTVTNSAGEQQVINFTVTLSAPVLPPPGTPNAITSFFQSRSTIFAGQEVAFAISTGVVQDRIIWDFGDGTPQVLDVFTIDHQYNNPGTFEGFVEVQGEGVVERRQFTVTVSQSILTPSNRIDFLFSGTPNVGENISMRSNPGGGTPPFVNWDWDLGDGNRTSGSDKMNIVHQYNQPGTYTVVCTVTDSAGQTAVAQRTLVVTVSALQFGDARISVQYGEFAAGDVKIVVTNNRSDVRIDGRLNIRVFDGSRQLDSRTTLPTIQPNTSAQSFYLFPASLPTNRQLRLFVEIKDNATNRLLDDDFSDFTITESLPPPDPDPQGTSRISISAVTQKLTGGDNFRTFVTLTNNTSQTIQANLIDQLRDPFNVVQDIGTDTFTLGANSTETLIINSNNLKSFRNQLGTWFLQLFVWKSIDNPDAFSRTIIEGLVVT